MVVKSVIDIEVDPEGNFARFSSLFNQYQRLLSGTPKAWAQVANEVKGTRQSFDLLVARMAAANVQSKLYAQAQKEADRLTRTSAEKWKDIARSTKEAASYIKEATLSLLKWSAVTTAVGGLLGAGGLWGIDRLALGAAAGRRSALGLGTTFGQQQAFEVNYGRLVEPGQFLSGVNEALHDVSKRYLLAVAGLTGDLSGKNTADVGDLLLGQLKGLADRTPTAMLAQVLQARGLDQFISLQDFERLKNTRPEEFNQLRRGFAADARTFAVRDRDLKAWQDFVTQLSRAGTTMETALLPALRPIADAFSKLSDAVAKTLGSFVKSDAFAQWVSAAETGIESLAKFLGSQEFQNDLKTFEDGLKAAGQAAMDFLRFLGYVKGPQTPRQVAASKASTWDVIMSSFGFGGYHPGGKFIENPKTMNDVLNNIYGKESDFGRRAGVSSKGAMGPFQIMPDTARQYGLTGPWDYDASRATAQQILGDYLREFHGDLRKAVAAYNWGPGHLERDIKSHGANWENFLPAETSGYLKKVLGNRPAPGTVIKIENNTGGSAVISTSQVAQ